jgi:hypothetical protein
VTVATVEAPAAPPKRSAAAERQKRWRENRAKLKAAGVAPAAPPRTAAARAHRVTFGGGVDFRRFMDGDGEAPPASDQGEAPSSPPPRRDPFAQPEPAEEPVTAEEAAPYGLAVGFYVGLGMTAMAKRLGKLLSDEERAMLLAARTEVSSFMAASTVKLCIKHKVRANFVDELAVAAGIGLSTMALFWGKGGKGIGDAIKLARAADGDADDDEVHSAAAQREVDEVKGEGQGGDRDEAYDAVVAMGLGR